MEDNKKVAEVLNDLILINNDRVNGYEKAIKELKDSDSDLKTLFEGFIDQSRNLRNALGTEVEVLKVKMDDGTSTGSKIHRAWIDVKSLFTGHDRQTILNSCEAGEDAAQKAYKTALGTEGIPAFISALINTQKDDLKKSHDEVKALRDQNKMADENA